MFKRNFKKKIYLIITQRRYLLPQMSCGCNGSSSAVNARLNNALTVSNGYTQSVVNPLNNNFTAALVNPMNNNNFTTVNSGFTQAVVNPLNNNFTTSTNCSSLLGATYSTLSSVEQSYTSNPQVTSLPGTQPTNLTVGTSNYVTSVNMPLLSSNVGFVNYYVRPTSTYLNTCY